MISTEAPMRIEKFSFGHITIDGVNCDHAVVIDRGKIRKRVKKPSKKLRDAFAHTPLSAAEEIPWKCPARRISRDLRRLVIDRRRGRIAEEQSSIRVPLTIR
jgi:hypothetical protein